MSHFVTLVNFYMPKLEETAEENSVMRTDRRSQEKLAQDPESFALRFLLKRLQSKASTLERSAEREIDELMAPFCEGTDDPAYLEFEDRTDDLRRDFETDKNQLCPFSGRNCRSGVQPAGVRKISHQRWQGVSEKGRTPWP